MKQIHVENDKERAEIIQQVLKSKRMVIITGAGISVAAGLPAFRGAGGLYNMKQSSLLYGFTGKVQDLFSLAALKDPTTKGIHFKMIANLAKCSVLATPTTFHYMLRDLKRLNALLRIYSQNIDGLERKVGFDMDPAIELSNTCIPLHGTVHFLRCTICSSTHVLQNYYVVLESGQCPLCIVCQQEQTLRSSANQRTRTVGHLRPDMVLYGEEHIQGDVIAAACHQDLNLDLLLIVGTSLKVPGTAQLVKQFSKKLHDGGLKSCIFVSQTAPSSEWCSTFDVFVEGDCQIFAMELRKVLANSLPEVQAEEDHNQSLQAHINDLGERKDFRPTWRWM